MSIPHKTCTYIIVANGSTAKVFHSKNITNHIALVTELSSPTARLHNRELEKDKPGRVFESANAAKHAIEHKLDAQTKEKKHFASNIADFLENELDSHKFDQLILIASPEFLSDIREELYKSRFIGRVQAILHKDIGSLITREVHKDLTHFGEKEILPYLIA